MELLQLKYFCDAAETQNFSTTAKKYLVPPSNISQSIKRLEKELGIFLFDRKSNRIALNEMGKAFYEKVKKALSLLDEATNIFIKTEKSNSIKLSITSNRRIVMSTIEKYKMIHPDIDIVARYYYSNDEDFDIVVSPDAPREDGYTIINRIPEKISLALTIDSPLYEKSVINAEMLTKEKFVSMDEGSSFYRTTMKICSSLGFKPHIAILANDPFYVRKCVEMGLGVAFVPEFSWKGQFADNVIFKSIGDYYRDTYICKNVKRPIEKEIDEFLKLLSSEIDSELQA